MSNSLDLTCYVCGDAGYPCGCMKRSTPTPVSCPSCKESSSEFTLSVEHLLDGRQSMFFVCPSCDGRVLEEVGDGLFIRLEPDGKRGVI